ncbi:MAG: ion transporter [Verrucomicrobia bacterium]|nr:MAG: ion transporter [Verrucomicrobiota bacterium]
MISRKRIWEILQVAKPGDFPSRVFDITILSLIVLNVLAVVLESVPGIARQWASSLDAFETGSLLVFTAEYAARLWSCTADPRYASPWRGRLRLARQPMLLVDLLAILPFYLPFLGVDLRTLRALRLFRILRIAKMGRYYSSLALIGRVVRSKKEELIMATALTLILLLFSSTLLYYCENPVQPEVFSSIPAAMWWAVATLTTVGYGDMYPVTPMGKLCAGAIAVLGIGLFALPAGILGSGFVEEIQKQKEGPKTCPHCGKELP